MILRYFTEILRPYSMISGPPVVTGTSYIDPNTMRCVHRILYNLYRGLRIFYHTRNLRPYMAISRFFAMVSKPHVVISILFHMYFTVILGFHTKYSLSNSLLSVPQTLHFYCHSPLPPPRLDPNIIF